MKLEVSMEEMRQKKIFIGTPMYGGQCHGMNSKACIDLQAMAIHHGIEVKFFFLFIALDKVSFFSFKDTICDFL